MNTSLIIYISSLLLFGTNGIVAAAIPLESAQIVMLRTFIGGSLLAIIAIVIARKMAAARTERSCKTTGTSDTPPRKMTAACIAHRCKTTDVFDSGSQQTPVSVKGSRRQLGFVVASGICTGFSWITLYEAYRLVGVGVASLEYYCAPIIVMLVSVPLFKEHFSTRKVVGFVVVLAGTLLVGDGSLAGGGSAWGLTLGAISAVCHAGMVILSKKAPDVSGLTSSSIQIVLSCIIASFFCAATQEFGFLTTIPTSAWLPIVVLGVANTGLGCLMYFTSILKLPAQTVSTLGYLEPLSAVVFAVIILGEPFCTLQWLGAALVIGGAIISQGHAPSSRTRTPISGKESQASRI